MTGMMQSLFDTQPVSVTELCRRIRRALRTQFPAPVRVLGEISKVSKVSGNLYFALKDREGYIDCICFELAARQLEKKLVLQAGMAVEATGLVEIYEPKSKYQLRVTGLVPVGRGALYLAFEQLKARLAAEGLFDQARKRKIPTFIRDVAIVTSKDAAVLADFLTTCRRRGAHVKVRVVHSRVQGEGAAPDLVRAIAAAGRLPVDVIVIARGGGTIEDLWAYNTEEVARAIARSPLPVISAVGHETDFTIADLVADMRAPTATAAAEFVAAEREALLTRIAAAHARLHRAAQRITVALARMLEGLTAALQRAGATMISGRRQRLDTLALSLAGHDPRRMLRSWRERTALAAARLPLLATRTLRVKREGAEAASRELEAVAAGLLAEAQTRVRFAHGRLSALGPRQTLQRGYAIAYDSHGRVLTSAAKARVGENISVELKSGALGAEVKTIRSDHGQAAGEADV
jgi:exodeoxyribonuclease VII large subunit